MSDAPDGDRERKRLPTALEDEVLAALDRSDTERDTVIAGILRREPDHANEIRRWLQEAGALPGAADAQTPQTRIGPWRVLRLLGRGGFGAVYLAESEDGAQAAVKVLGEGFTSREVLRRFAAEREALLRLDHPGIARILAAGETDAGRPWFAMEYVEGSSLLVHCRRARLPVAKVLPLFLRAIDAVAHAHQRGILHRDLSANNVLVAGTGDDAQPKIIDFGIAKSTDGSPLASGPLTFQTTVMGTPEYMSPEQATGEPGSVDTRADVYSLGVQLYELLTDRLPVPSEQLRAHGALRIAEVLQKHEPEPPSAVAPTRQRRALRGDLDSIVMRAIAKDRDERYASAAEFAADLRRHLANEPVLAANASAWYLLRKDARRHRARFAFVAATAAAIVGALFVAAQQWREATEARTELAAALDSLAQRSQTGFRLLACQQRLVRAAQEEASLVPAWPSKAPAMREWLRAHAAPMRATLQELEQQRAELAADEGTQRAQVAAAGLDLVFALDRMRDELRRFVGDDGAVAAVERRLRFAEQRVAPALARDAAAWAAIAADMQRSSSSLPPQPGLVPLGKNPRTGLHEFLDLATHDERAPLPTRGPDGELAKSADAGIVFVLVPRATARLGAQRTEAGMERFDPEAQRDEIGGGSAMLDDYFVARTELTRAQWARLSGAQQDGQPDLPQTDVDWNEATATLRVYGMDLPTEAQWEHACRAGTTTPWWTGSSLESLGEAAAFGVAPQAVAMLRENPFGLFDVHGNVAEWCRDWKHDYASAQLRTRDGLLSAPTPVRMPELRSVRGGNTAQGPFGARSSARSGRIPSAKDPLLGIRPVRALARG